MHHPVRSLFGPAWCETHPDSAARMAFFFFHAAAVCILTNTLTEQAVQVFGLFRDFGDWMDGEPKEQEQNSQSWEAVFPFDTFSPS
jgi:hypothetical protein